MENGTHFVIKMRNSLIPGFSGIFTAKAKTYEIRGFLYESIGQDFHGVAIGEQADVRSFLLDIQFSPETRPWLIYSLETTVFPPHLFPSNVGMEVVG